VKPRLALSLRFADGSHRALLPRHRVARWLGAALEREAEIAVRIVGSAEARRLNRDYRGQDHATNVLTFDYEREPRVVADLVLCAAVIEREACERGIEIAAHYAHLVVHGALHAQGWRHDRDDAARRMQARESALLSALGIADPHRR